MYHYGNETARQINPREKANILSIVTFFFTWNLLKNGYRNDVIEDDIYQVPKKFQSSKLAETLEKQWSKQIKSGNSSLYRLLWNCYGKYYLMLGFIQLIVKVIMIIVHPRAFSKLVSYFTTNNTNKMTKMDAIYYACLVIALNIINTTYSHNYMFWITELGIKIKTALCSLIYRKSLKMTSSKLSEIGIGKVITLVSKDVASIESALIFLNDMWIGLILIIITSGLMYAKVGVAAFAGTLFLISIIPIQVLLGKLTSTLRIKASRVTDERLQVTQETISVIKIVKMYTLECFFGQRISSARKKEMKKIRQIYWTKATSLVIGGLVINLTLYIIVMTYVKIGNLFTAEVSFFIWDCLRGLRSTIMASIPLGIVQTAELYASLSRIRQLLLITNEQNENKATKNNENKKKPLVEMENVSVKINNTVVLQRVNLKISTGLNFVAGRLGGGKSSLLKTILGDYEINEGKLKVNGKISYTSEEPWLFPSSIRQNILFGQKFNEVRYRKVIKVCALEMDIETFDDGDETILHDRGMNLSKGQQARISLARAVYCNSDIYLLDDCLSSLDTHLQQFIFTECIKKFLSDKVIIMISHNQQQLREADNVIHMEKGTIKSLMKPNDIPDEDIEDLIRENDKIEGDNYGNDIIDDIVNDDDDDDDEEEEEQIKDDSKLLKPQFSQNIYYEKKKEGQVDYNIYRKYGRYGGGLLVIIPLIVVFILAQFMSSYSEKLVSNWVNIQQNLSDYKAKATNNTKKYFELEEKNNRTLRIYSLAIVGSTFLLLFRAYCYFSFAGKVSIAIHKAMALSVLQATMKFFDLNHIGNILNRFSKDLGTIDEILPLNLYECLNLFCRLNGMLILILIVKWKFIIPTLFIFFALFLLRKWYLPTGRSLKRLDAATRSPMIGHINASLEGLAVIRAYGTKEILVREFDKHQDLYTSAYYMMQSTTRAFAYFLDMLCNCFIIVIVFGFVFAGKDTLAGNVGLAIAQALGITGLLQWGVRQWADLENHMTSVERVSEYTNVEQEVKNGQILENNWPSDGKIQYKNVNLTYGNTKEYVLKNINFVINSKEKIGIVGRTGAGKSSLISILFRLYSYQGTIYIDDVDIKSLDLTFLRSNIAIIPQDPILFTGTIRSNIDPTDSYTDEQLWHAIGMANLQDLVPALEYKITEGGSNFSSGQRQLLCLVRAIISKCKIIILDEATSNVDSETEVMIYSTIQENFSKCTVLTIAHRLHTVLNSDKVMVIDKGEIIEFANPDVLLDNKNGVFYKMVEQANLLK